MLIEGKEMQMQHFPQKGLNFGNKVLQHEIRNHKYSFPSYRKQINKVQHCLDGKISKVNQTNNYNK